MVLEGFVLAEGFLVIVDNLNNLTTAVDSSLLLRAQMS